MKKTILPIILALAALSCSRAPSDSFPLDGTEPQYATLTVNITDAESTKSTLTTWQDGTVSSASVFVFNSDGSYDNSATASGAVVTVKCTVGTGKQVYVVVNKTIDGVISTTSDLESKVTSLTDNTASHFVMSGKVTGVEVKTTGNDPVNVEVVRHAAKVSIGSITNSLSETGWKDLEFKVTGIYLINVAGGDAPLFATSYTPSVWYNKMQHGDTACDALLYDSMNSVIANTATLSGTHTFYCMPNPTSTDANAGSWSPRKTRLVIQTQIGTGTYYYPITLGSVARNTHYSITNLEITRLGSNNPDTPVSGSLMTFNITVKDWTIVNMATQTI